MRILPLVLDASTNPMKINIVFDEAGLVLRVKSGCCLERVTHKERSKWFCMACRIETGHVIVGSCVYWLDAPNSKSLDEWVSLWTGLAMNQFKAEVKWS